MGRKGLRVWRWFGVGLLAVGALPLGYSRWRAAAPATPAASGAVNDLVPNEIVVQLKENARSTDALAVAQRAGLSLLQDYGDAGEPRLLELSVPPAQMGAALAQLRGDARVEAAEPQRIFHALWAPNDPRYPEQWNFRRIHMEQAWEITRGKGAVVAVIDTGVAFENDGVRCHRCKDFANAQFTAPYDFVHRDRHPMDDHGHGTHVAGTIAESTDNGEGVAGIAFEATIMPLKVLTAGGSGRMSDIAAAIRYAADHGANIINMSLGSPFPDAITRGACQYARQKGVTIVCAAGNGGSRGVGYPAAYPDCIAVSALGPTGALAFYSSWGPEVALSAPGGDTRGGPQDGILQNTFFAPRPGGQSAALGGGEAEPAAGQVDDYYAFQGTSMASPHVAGVAALVVAQGVRDPDEVRAVLTASAQSRGDREKFGAGELDALAAAKRAQGVHRQYLQTLALLGGVWLAALAAGKLRRKAKGAPAWVPALAATIGLVLPDLAAMAGGYGSLWNLLGHSVLLPAFLLVTEAESDGERRFYGLFAAGLVVHLGLDIYHGAMPAAGLLPWAAVPWLWSNLIVGLGTMVAGLRRAAPR